MTKKDLSNPYEGMTYQPKIVPAFTPMAWAKGTFKKGAYTGKAKQDIQGYRLIIMAWLNDKEYGIIEPIPSTATHSQTRIFETHDKAKQYFDEHHAQDFIPGNFFNPVISRFPSGIIGNFEL